MLEELAFEFIDQNEDALGAIGFGIAFLGFVIALIVQSRAKGELQRAPYFALSMLLFLISSALTFMWLSSLQVILLGFLWVLVGAVFLGTAVVGYFYGVIALARSRDAYGHGRYATLAWIPIANFWLLLKESKNALSINRVPTIPLLSGGVGVIVGFVVAAAGIGLSATFQVYGDRMIEKLDLEASMARMIRYQGLEKALQFIAASPPQLPIVIDEVTTLTTIVADGSRLRSTFVVALDDVTLSDQFRAEIERGICTYEPFILLLRDGAAIEEVYVKANGSAIGRHIVTRDMCGL